jgi:nuclease S1
MFRSIVGLLLMLVARPAFGWGCSGHETVALIALGQLNPHARQMVSTLLAGAPPDPASHRFCKPTGLAPIADLSTWADDEREREPRTAAWHFLDIPLSAGRGSLDPFCGAGCVSEAIREQVAVLRSGQGTQVERQRALLFVIHFVADLHQPLHVATNNDRGGNCFPVGFLRERPRLTHPASGGYRPELHGVWDTQLPERIGRIRHGTHDADVRAFAASLSRQYSREIAQWRRQPVDPEAWAWENHKTAVVDVYGGLPKPVAVEPAARVKECSDDNHVSDRLAALQESLQQPYIAEMRPVVREQLAKAGARLAAVLNQLWP